MNPASKLITIPELIEKAKSAGFDFGVGKPAHLIHHYVQIGLLPKAVRAKPSGVVGHTVGCYPEDTIETLLKIQNLRNQGMSVTEIRVQLLEKPKPEVTTPYKPRYVYVPTNYRKIGALFTFGLILGIFSIAGLTYSVNAIRGNKYSEPSRRVRIDSNPKVLAATAVSGYLEINADASFSGTLDVTSLNINGVNINIDQSLTRTSSPTFNSITIGGVKLDNTTVLAGASQTLTNKSLSGSSNTFSNIPTSAITGLSDLKITVTAGDNLTGGGVAKLGDSVTLGLADDVSIDGSFRPPITKTTTPSMGNVIYNTDTNSLNVYNGTAWSAIGGVAYWSALQDPNGDATMNMGTYKTTWQWSSGGKMIFNGTGVNTALIVDNIDGDLIAASSSGVNKFLLTKSGDLTVAGSIYASNFYVGTGGTAGFLQRQNGAIMPANITDSLLIGATATSSALFSVEGTTGDVIVNGYIKSNLTPIQGSLYDLGTNTRHWRTIYADNIVGAISGDVDITGTTSNDWRINTNNATTDAEDTTITFERGLPAVNAELRWNSGTKSYLSTNVPFLISPDTGIPDAGHAALIVNQTFNEDIFSASLSGVTKFLIDKNGNVGIGTTNATAKLSIGGATSIISNSSGDMTIAPAANLIISTTGNVGIGTTNPGATLQVGGAGENLQIYQTNGTGISNIKATGTNGEYMYLTYGSSSAIRFFSGSTKRFDLSYLGEMSLSGASILLGDGSTNTIKQSSSDPIGVNGMTITNPLWITGVAGYPGSLNNARHALDINFSLGGGGVPASGTVTGGNAGKLNVYLRAGGAGSGGAASGTDGSFNIINSSSANIFSVLNSGNVGIGTTSPTTALQIDGDLTVGKNGFGTQRKIILEGNGTDEAYIQLRGNESSGGSYGLDFLSGSGTRLYASGTDSIVFGSMGYLRGTWAEKMRITGAGNVGIGTTAPLTKLQISGDSGLIVDTDRSAYSELPSGVWLSSKATSISITSQYNPIDTDGKIVLGYRRIADNAILSALEVQNIATAGTYSNLLLMKSGGNVGIGTTSPGAKLEVVDTLSTGVAYFQAKDSSAGLFAKLYRVANQSYGLIDGYGNGITTTAGNVINMVSGSANTVSFSSGRMQPAGDYVIKGGNGAIYNTTLSGNDPYNSYNGGPLYLTGGTYVGPNQSSNYNGGNVYVAGGAKVASGIDGNVILAHNGTSSLGNVGIGTTNPFAKLDVLSTSGAQQRLSYNSSNYANFTVDSAGSLTIGTAGTTGDIILSPYGSGSPTFLSDTGYIVFGGNNNTNNEDLQFDFETTADTIGLSSSTGVTGFSFGSFNIGINNSTPANKLSISSATTADSLADVLIGTSAITQKGLVIQGKSGQTANLFEVQNSTGAIVAKISSLGTAPIASLSGRTSFAGLVVDNSLGDLFTASSSGLSRFVITQSGNVGIGTTSPAQKLDVAGSGKFTSTVLLPSISRYNGYDTNLSFYGSVAINQGSHANGAFDDRGHIDLNVTSLSPALTIDNNGDMYAFGNVGIGTTSPISKLDVRGTSGITPVASISGQTAFAAMVVDNKGVGDIFTASSSGLTRFVITQNGNVGIGTTSPSALLDVNSLFTVDTAQINFNVPVAFNTPGDLSLSSDLSFTNSTLSNITSNASLAIYAGLNYNSDNITLGTYNSGNVIIDSQAFLTNYSATISGQLIVGASVAPANIGNFYLTNNATYGKALAILNQTESQDIFTASASGVSKFVITNAGNVGIGTTNPTTPLEVNGISTLKNYSIYYSSGTMSGYVGGGNLVAKNNNDMALRSQSSIYFSTNDWSNIPMSIIGKTVGIGTTSPIATLDVRGNSGITPVASISGQTAFAAMVVDNKGVGDIFTASSSGLNRFVITQNGNVGIGTASPVYKLDVRAPTGGILNLYNTTRNHQWTVLTSGIDNDDLVFQDGSGFNALQLKTTGDVKVAGTALYAIYNGSVGIGTTVPLATFDVRGNTGTTPVASISGNTIQAALIVDNSHGSGDLFTASNSGNKKFVIANTGDVTIYGSATTCVIGNGTSGTSCSSDIRLKENINNLGSTLDKVINLQPVTFNWKNGTTVNTGLIAQDVQKLFPELVHEVGNTGYLGIDYAGLTVPLIQATKDISEQLKDIPQIKSDIALLKEEMASASARLTKVETDVSLRGGSIATDAAIFSCKGADCFVALAPRNDMNIATLSADIAKFNESLTVLGKTQLSETSIGGNLNVGFLHFDDIKAEISSLTGLVTVKGTLKVEKGLILQDQDTGEDYCVQVKSGEIVKKRGNCQ